MSQTPIARCRARRYRERIDAAVLRVTAKLRAPIAAHHLGQRRRRAVGGQIASQSCWAGMQSLREIGTGTVAASSYCAIDTLKDGSMNRYLSSAVAGASLLFVASAGANAAPLAPPAPTADPNVEKVHGYHRDCRRGHRHNRWGEWRSCGHSYRGAPGIYLRFGGDRYRGRHHGYGGRHHGYGGRHHGYNRGSGRSYQSEDRSN